MNNFKWFNNNIETCFGLNNKVLLLYCCVVNVQLRQRNKNHYYYYYSNLLPTNFILDSFGLYSH